MMAMLGEKKMKVFVRRKVGAVARTDASAEEFQNRLASGLKKAEDLLNARAAQIWKAEQSKVSHDVSKAKFRIPFSLRFSAEGGDFELKLQFVSSGSHGIPAKTMDSATMGKVVRIIKSSLGASSINASPLRISSGGTGGAPTIGFLTLKGKVAVERGDAYDLSASHEVVVKAGKLELKKISSQMRDARMKINDLSSRLAKLKKDTAHLGGGSLFGEISPEVKKEILSLEQAIKEILPFAH